MWTCNTSVCMCMNVLTIAHLSTQCPSVLYIGQVVYNCGSCPHGVPTPSPVSHGTTLQLSSVQMEVLGVAVNVQL